MIAPQGMTQGGLLCLLNRLCFDVNIRDDFSVFGDCLEKALRMSLVDILVSHWIATELCNREPARRLSSVSLVERSLR